MANRPKQPTGGQDQRRSKGAVQGEPMVLTLREAAVACRLSYSGMRKLIREGRGPTVRSHGSSKSTFILRTEFEEWLQNRPIVNPSEIDATEDPHDRRNNPPRKEPPE